MPDDVLEGAADGFGQCRTVLCACGRPDTSVGAPTVLKFRVILADEVGEDLGVSLRDEFVAFGEEPFFELLMVFDHAVVDERDFAGLVEMRVRVLVGRRAVSRPAGMADAGRARGGLLAQERSQIVDAASLLPKFELAVVQNAKPGRIVTAIFETAQAFEDDVGGRLCTDVADDATHRFSPFLEVAPRRFHQTRVTGQSAAMANHDGVDFDAFVFVPPIATRLTQVLIFVN